MAEGGGVAAGATGETKVPDHGRVLADSEVPHEGVAVQDGEAIGPPSPLPFRARCAKGGRQGGRGADEEGHGPAALRSHVEPDEVCFPLVVISWGWGAVEGSGGLMGLAAAASRRCPRAVRTQRLGRPWERGAGHTPR